MHDVIRDVAISIASGQHSFMVRCDRVLEDWPENVRLKNYAVISLKLDGMHGLPGNIEFPNLKLLQLDCNARLPRISYNLKKRMEEVKVHGLPGNLEFSNLKLLQLDCNARLPRISYDLNKRMEEVKVQETQDGFYQGMKELKVLSLSYMYSSLPASLGCLINLRTLLLFRCRLIDDDISVIGALKNLEILSFAGSYIKELPKEIIGHLAHLKVLDLLGCVVERIYPGVLSSLLKLEELYVGTTFQRCCKVEESKEGAKAIIDELASLSNLVALDIALINVTFWPRGLVVEKLCAHRMGISMHLLESHIINFETTNIVIAANSCSNNFKLEYSATTSLCWPLL
ncbi:Leucine-rich repeat-containing protein 15 [Camellia lanceoleosa]|nr:Leucine-rich repeat-containing protein 15 [Camellia lanceoleosa]